MSEGRILQSRTRTECPVCQSRDFISLRSMEVSDPPLGEFLAGYYKGRLPLDRLQGWTYVLSECRSCGLVFQQQVLDDQGLSILYEEILDAEASLRKRERAGRKYFSSLLSGAAKVFWFFPEISSPRDIRVLDFGMGWGHWCAAAGALGLNAYGTDLSVARQDFARSLGVNVIPDLSNAEERFHFINAEQVLEHVVELGPTAKLLSGLLETGGILRVAVPDGTGLSREAKKKDWRPAKDAAHPLEHVNAFSFPSLTTLMRGAGLRPVTWKDVHGVRATVSALRKHTFRRSQPTWFFKKG